MGSIRSEGSAISRTTDAYITSYLLTDTGFDESKINVDVICYRSIYHSEIIMAVFGVESRNALCASGQTQRLISKEMYT